jgi:nitroreductase / dihydropteridine reductase
MRQKDIRERYSVKKFDSEKKLTDDQVAFLMDAFRYCPSSFNSQPWRLIVVSKPEMKNRLAAAGKDTNGDRIRECSHLLLLVRRPVTVAHARKVIESTPIFLKLIERLKLSTGKLAGYLWFYAKQHGGRHWAAHQVYLAMGFLLAACASAGIGALPMEGIQPRKMDRILGLQNGERTVLALAVGYPHKDDAENPSRLEKARLPFNDVIQLIQ